MAQILSTLAPYRHVTAAWDPVRKKEENLSAFIEEVRSSVYIYSMHVFALRHF
jgi:hypothetical protein